MKRFSKPVNRGNRLRASCLGANDGILSTAGLLVGVAATSMTRDHVFLAGLAGAAAGALSMAVGEYVSVSAQNDIEKAEIEKSHDEDLAYPRDAAGLRDWLMSHGASDELAIKAAEKLSYINADNFKSGQVVTTSLPLQAATTSALSFVVGASVPLLAATFAASDLIWHTVAASSLFALAGLGAFGASLAGAPFVPAIIRVVSTGGFAMAGTWWLGRLIDGAVP